MARPTRGRPRRDSRERLLGNLAEVTPHIVGRKPTSLWRIHRAKYRAPEFHPGERGRARFSPIFRADGLPIPTLYAASTLDGALMESVFHDVPTPPAGHSLDLDTLRDQELVVSRIRLSRSVKLVDLSSKGMKRLGLTRADLIDTPAARYAETRNRAEHFHAQTEAKGLAWISKQDDEASAFLFFGDRIDEGAFKVEVNREPLWVTPHLDAVVALAERIGISEIYGS